MAPVTSSLKPCILQTLQKEATEIRFRMVGLRCHCIMSLWQLTVEAKSSHYPDFASFPHQNNKIIRNGMCELSIDVEN